MDIKKDIMWRIYLIFFAFGIFGLAIIVQIFRIQFVQGSYWRAKADSLSTQIKTIEAARGNIISCDGSLLATSVPIYDIRIDAKANGLTDQIFNNGIDSLAICLSDLFKDRSKADYKHDLREARSENDRYHLIQRNISYTDLQKVKMFPLFHGGRNRGCLVIEQKTQRKLPFKQLASRTIGYMRDVKPVGIEAAFDDDLQGVTGRRLMQRIAGGVWMPLNDKEEIEPKDGNDIITTIDINIQDVAESALEEHLRKQDADRGCVAVMEVATGEIKAIANLTRMPDGSYAESFNYMIAEATEPGSTMKLASLLSAIDDGLVDVNDTVNVGNGQCTYFGQPMKDSHAPKKSRYSVKEAFMESSNVGISKVIYAAYAKHPQDFLDNLKSYGLNNQLGLQISGEGKPRIKNVSDKDWAPVSLPWTSIGYEVKLTPLQILTFYNAIANNGKMVKPKFVREIRNHGQLVKLFETETIKDSIASPSSIAKARELLEAVVDSGTGKGLLNPYYRVAGKTGTAQMFQSKLGSYNKGQSSYQASFVGYFPADQPKYSAMVVIYNPSSGLYYGGAVSLPVFKEIADKVYSNHLDLHDALAVTPSSTGNNKQALPLIKKGNQKNLNKIFAKLNIEPSDRSETASAPVQKRGGILTVPNVVGMGIRDALYILENSGLNVQTSGKGMVTKQSLDPGTKIQKGQKITIQLS